MGPIRYAAGFILALTLATSGCIPPAPGMVYHPERYEVGGGPVPHGRPGLILFQPGMVEDVQVERARVQMAQACYPFQAEVADRWQVDDTIRVKFTCERR